MSIYDIAMIIVFLGCIWFGYWKGLAWQVASVAAIFLSYFVAVTFPDAISPYISAEPPFNRFAAMLILFIGTSLIVWTIFASVSKSLKKMELKGFDRQAGALLGAFKGAILAMLITMFSVSLLGEKARDAIHQSKTGYYVVRGIDQLSGIAPTELAQFLHPHIEKFQENIVDENGNLPPRNPIFDRNGEQQVNDQGQFGAPGNYPNGQNPGGQTQWQTPVAQAGYQQQQPQTNQGQQQWQGNYESGSIGGSQFGGSQFGGSQFGGSQFGGSQFGGSQFGGSQPPQNNGGFQQGTFGGQPQPPRQWEQPNSQQQFQNQTQNQNQTQWHPPQSHPNANQSNQQNQWGTQFPKISEGDNGWPNVQFNVNSKDLLERGADAALGAGRQWLENQRQ